MIVKNEPQIYILLIYILFDGLFFGVKYLHFKYHLWVFSSTKRSRKRHKTFCYGRVHSIVAHHKNCNQFLF